MRAAAFLPAMIWLPFFPALLIPGVSAWPDSVTPFLFVSPQVVWAGIIVALSVAAVVLDTRSRERAP
jgi:hypothetical protein